MFVLIIIQASNSHLSFLFFFLSKKRLTCNVPFIFQSLEYPIIINGRKSGSYSVSSALKFHTHKHLGGCFATSVQNILSLKFIEWNEGRKDPGNSLCINQGIIRKQINVGQVYAYMFLGGFFLNSYVNDFKIIKAV